MREILRELREEGIFDHKGGSGGRGGGKDVDALPNVCVVEVERIDSDGELHARPVKSEAAEGLFPDIFIAPETPSQGALGVGDRVLARLTPNEDGSYQANAIRVLDTGGGRLIGRFVASSGTAATGAGGRIEPAEKRARNDYLVAPEHVGDAVSGELVLAELLPGRSLGLPRARVTERLGDMNAPNAISLLAIHANLIPTEFSAAAL
ncbi:MAG: ribonuclease R, partial [Rhodospirillaceae bacterium]|nr:ribonuclease R [Rhodospirillaceae bacterium]